MALSQKKKEKRKITWPIRYRFYSNGKLGSNVPTNSLTVTIHWCRSYLAVINSAHYVRIYWRDIFSLCMSVAVILSLFSMAAFSIVVNITGGFILSVGICHCSLFPCNIIHAWSTCRSIFLTIDKYSTDVNDAVQSQVSAIWFKVITLHVIGKTFSSTL